MTRILHLLTTILLALFVSECMPKKNLTCLTGYKILARHPYTTMSNQIKYKLQYVCLCPNNYVGEECQDHLGIDCYLNPINQLQQINESNIKEEMVYEVEFSVDCYVPDKRIALLKKIQLRQFLSLNNEANAYGVREQFGANYEIIWANDTELFDLEGKLIAEKNKVLTKDERAKLIIGDNQKLQKSPFTYAQKFLGFGLINGNVSFRVDVINPEYGMKKLGDYQLTQSQITGEKEYADSYMGLGDMNERRDKLIDEIRDMVGNGSLTEAVQKYMNGSQRPQDVNNLFNRSDSRLNPQMQQKPLPVIRLPIKVNPYNSTFYESIRIEVSMRQSYQQIVYHQASLNSGQWVIPVKVPNLGLPEPTQKSLKVTDTSNKSYYRILLVVGIAGMVYLGLTYGYKRYKKWKNKQYTEFEDESMATSTN